MYAKCRLHRNRKRLAPDFSSNDNRIQRGGHQLPSKKAIRSFFVASMVFTLVMSACGGAPAAAPATPTGPQVSALDTACAEGAKEGKVVYAGGFTPEPFDRIIAPFRAKYPGIQVEFIAGADQIQRVITETTANRLSIDVVQISVELQALKDRGLLVEDIKWADLSVTPNLVNSYGAVRILRVVRGVGYNTTKTQASDLPPTWDGLIDAKWSGQIAVDPRGLALSILVLEWGKDKLADYARRLVATSKPKLIQGITASLTAVGSGEVAISTDARDAEIAELKGKGAPLAIHYFDLIPVSDSYQALIKGAPHPNAAKCLMAWLVSKDGQDMLLKVDNKSNLDQPPSAPRTAKLLIPDTAEKAALIVDAQKILAPILTAKP
jgi:iron(III) transport system substrate-binding protein